MIGPGGTGPPGIGIGPGLASTNTSSPVITVAFWRYLKIQNMNYVQSRISDEFYKSTSNKK